MLRRSICSSSMLSQPGFTIENAMAFKNLAADVEAERDPQVLEVSLKMETEVRPIDALNAELVEVRADAPNLIAARQELAVKLKLIDNEMLQEESSE
ncbi:hypothetical protein U1Q18_036977 [Sarracenia purpurea var. burkii]